MVSTRAKRGVAGDAKQGTETAKVSPHSPKKVAGGVSKPAQKVAQILVAKPAKAAYVQLNDALPTDLPGLVLDSGAPTTLVEILRTAEKGAVFFFYPKASTPGCTTQAELFRDHYAEFQAKGYAVYGCSKDAPAPQTRWKQKLGLPYHLLTDATGDFMDRFNILKEQRKIKRSLLVVAKGAKGEGSFKVAALELQTGPQASLDAAKRAVASP